VESGRATRRRREPDPGSSYPFEVNPGLPDAHRRRSPLPFWAGIAPTLCRLWPRDSLPHQAHIQRPRSGRGFSSSAGSAKPSSAILRPAGPDYTGSRRNSYGEGAPLVPARPSRTQRWRAADPWRSALAHVGPSSATLNARSRRRRASSTSPRPAASPSNFPHASRNAGIALGSSTVAAVPGAPPASTTASLAAPGAPGVTEYGAPVVRGGGSRKDEGRDAPVSRETSRPSKSGRQDLNLRPLGPEGPQADPHGVVPGLLASYPLDTTGVDAEAGSHTVVPVPPDAPPFGALVVQDFQGPFLTVREVASRLRVSRATVYRLVRSGTFATVRVSNSIRIPASALNPTDRCGGPRA
jgi:excisionase family DNA binding protein